jgi:hypothetical protein
VQIAFKLLPPALDGFLIQARDLGQLAITRTTWLLGKQANVPATLWLIQAA